MLQAALASGEAHRRCVFEAFARRLPDGRRYGVVAGTGRVLEALEALPLRRRRAALPLRPERRRPADRRLARVLPLLRRRQRLRRGRVLLPPVAGARRRVDLRRGGHPRDPRPVDPQPRHGDRLGRLAHDERRRWPAVHRDGLAPHARGVGRRRRPGGLHRRVRRDEQPRGGPPLRRADDRHRRPRLHAPLRLRERGLHRPGRVARQGHDAARRHLRRAPRRRPRHRDRRSRAGRGAARLRRPAHPGHRGARPARRRRQPRHPHHRHVRPRRVRHRRARGRPGQRLRRRHRARHRVGRADGVDGLQARPARGRVGRHAGRGQEEQGQGVGRRPQVGDASPRRGRRRAGRGHRHRRAAASTTATTARS